MDELLETPYPRPLSRKELEVLPSGARPQHAALRGHSVQLEPLNPDEHAVSLYDVSHGSEEALEIWTYLPDGPWPDLNAFSVWLQQCSEYEDRVTFAIRPEESDRVCGMASYLDIQPQAGAIEIGYIWFAPELQRTRAATEALYLLIAHAMDDLNYRRMVWKCNSLNRKSRAAARRLGYRFEGIFYHHLVVKGRNRDTAWYSILDHEWPEVRDIMTAWLADDNFNEDGSAKTSLAAEMAKRG